MSIMTLEQAAKYLQIHPVTLRRHAIAGNLPAFKIGKEWRFLVEDIEGWARSSYSHPFRQELVSDIQGVAKCPLPNAANSGTYVLQRQTEKSLDELLAQKTGERRRSTTTG